MTIRRPSLPLRLPSFELSIGGSLFSYVFLWSSLFFFQIDISGLDHGVNKVVHSPPRIPCFPVFPYWVYVSVFSGPPVCPGNFDT
jgi:hypothetical protein